jgi:DNA-binding MarR family transcriptional regulator
MERQQSLFELQEMLNRIGKKAASEWNQEKYTGLSVTHTLILQILEEMGPQRPSALARELQITTGGVTGLTNKLVNKGYIERGYDILDRRVIQIDITDKGKSALQDEIKHRAKMTENLFCNLADSDIEELKRILRMILQEKRQNESTGRN